MRLLKKATAVKTEATAAWVRLHETDLETGGLTWCAPDGRRGQGTLSEAAAACQGAIVDVIVPGESILLAGAPMPKAGARQLRQAFPFAVEDNLAEDVEHLHFALAPWPRGRNADEPVYGAAVSHALMRLWTQQLRAAGLRIRHLVPDILCLPLNGAEEAASASEGTGADAPWTLCLEGERFVLRTGRYAGLAGERGLLTPVIAAAAHTEGEPRRIHVCDADDGARAPSGDGNLNHTSIYDLADVDGVHFERHEAAGSCSEVAGFSVERAAGMDLMQEPYRPDVAQTGGLRAWLWPAVLVWVLLGTNLTTVLIEHTRLAARQAGLQNDTSVLYRKTFPKDRRIVDARAQMEHHLNSLEATAGGGDKFVGLLAALGGAVRVAPALRVDAVSYRDGRLDVQLSAPSVALVQGLRDRLDRGGRFRTHIESIDADQSEQGGDKGRTQVRLSIEENKT